MGRSISKIPEGRGLQDAITPRWSTWIAILIYGLCLLGIGSGWYKFGWIIGLLSIVGLLLVARINHIFLPKKDSEHFKHIIISSLMRRYADYRRDEDTLRADAVASVLDRFGFKPPDGSSTLDKSQN
jgi:hypothetical protein